MTPNAQAPSFGEARTRGAVANWRRVAVAATAALLAAVTPAWAAPPLPMLLSTPTASTPARSAKVAPSPERWVARQRPVAVAFQLLDPQSADAPEAIAVELFDGEVVTIQRDRVEERGHGNYTWHGRVAGQGGDVSLTVVDGQISGSIVLFDKGTRSGRTYQVESGPDGAHALRRIDQDAFPQDHPPGGEQMHAPGTHEKRSNAAGTLSDTTSTTATVSTAADSGAEIDVMIVYSNQTAAAAGTAIGAQIQQAIDSANKAYANSAIATRLRLVHYQQVAYAESGDFNTDLNRLTSSGDGYMDDVHTLRKSHGADLVSLFIENGQYCGLAWVGPSAGYAFSVVNRGCATSNLSFAHELGHNFGALHDPYVDASNYPYAFGHGHANPTQRWRTVMAYNNACAAAGTSCTRIAYFSNPNQTYGSPASPLGTASTSDNARVHNQNAYSVANFKLAAAQGCTYALSTSGASIGAASTSGSVGVTAASGCAWNASSGASWLAIGSGSGTTGSGTLIYSAAANTGAARIGAITVGNQTLTVSQASGCTYSLSPSSASAPAAGGTGTATLSTAGTCGWSASSNANWLAVTTAANGSGGATVGYSVAANTSGMLRSANLTIGGATFIVTQAAAAVTAPTTPAVAPVASLSSTSINFGSQRVGTTSAPKAVKLTNTGGGTLTISSLTPGGANLAAFARSGTCAAGTSLAAGQSCTLQYTFAPNATGTQSATLTAVTNARTFTLQLSGRGSRR